MNATRRAPQYPRLPLLLPAPTEERFKEPLPLSFNPTERLFDGVVSVVEVVAANTVAPVVLTGFKLLPKRAMSK
ncbi:unnamed protein product [Schistosoma mattheei]|uniref:Uncharacterized protein n=1 Tax=Schistosoma mattheei TaxID=31246 RepID=A0A3P8DM38_9TREM|nr:unnamed protein product [Schistosoma mattheei]